jgi:hypothetical protein
MCMIFVQASNIFLVQTWTPWMKRPWVDGAGGPKSVSRPRHMHQCEVNLARWEAMHSQTEVEKTPIARETFGWNDRLYLGACFVQKIGTPKVGITPDELNWYSTIQRHLACESMWHHYALSVKLEDNVHMTETIVRHREVIYHHGEKRAPPQPSLHGIDYENKTY